MHRRSKVSTYVLFSAMCSCAWEATNSPDSEHTAERQATILDGPSVKRSVWAVDGSVARLGFNFKECSATPFADQWMLTAAHCLFKADRSFKTNVIKVNDGPGALGLWNGIGEPKADDKWVVVAHPTRDLALIHALPLGRDVDGLPKLPRDPLVITSPVAPGETLDEILGFGCNRTEVPAAPGLVAFTGSMGVSERPRLVPASAGVTFESWAARALPIPGKGVIAGGDSGGPARMDIDTIFPVLGELAKQRRLAGINYAAFTPGATAMQLEHCPWQAVTVAAGDFTTFDVKKGPNGKMLLGPPPLDWLNATRTELSRKPAPATTAPARIPGDPATHPDTGFLPKISWTDLDGDGVHDLYTWGNAGLNAVQNVAGVLQPEKTLMAQLPAPLLGLRPVLGNFDGDKKADPIVFSGSVSSPSMRYLTGSDPFAPTPFVFDLALGPAQQLWK